MAAFEFRPSPLTLAAAGAIFLPKQAYATEFSFENMYAAADGSIGREIITWPVSGREPVRCSLGPTKENQTPLLWVEMQQAEGVLDAQEEQDSDDSDEDEDDATPAESEPYVRPAVKPNTKAAPAPTAAKNKRASSDSLLKKTLISTARKTSTTKQAPPCQANGPFRPKKALKPRTNAQPFPLATKPFVLSDPLSAIEDPFSRTRAPTKPGVPLAPQTRLPHRPTTAGARVLGSPFSASDIPPLSSLRARNAAAEAAVKRSKPSSEWEARLARVQRASMRLQRFIAESDDPDAIFGGKLRDIDLETGGIR